MKANSKRQAEHHQKMIEAGFKKRSFYVSDLELDIITKHKEKNGFKNIHEALNDILMKINSK